VPFSAGAATPGGRCAPTTLLSTQLEGMIRRRYRHLGVAVPGAQLLCARLCAVCAMWRCCPCQVVLFEQQRHMAHTAHSRYRRPGRHGWRTSNPTQLLWMNCCDYAITPNHCAQTSGDSSRASAQAHCRPHHTAHSSRPHSTPRATT